MTASKHARKFTIRRRVADYFIPRILPGTHHPAHPAYVPPRDSCITDYAAFTAWAVRRGESVHNRADGIVSINPDRKHTVHIVGSKS